MQVTVRVPPGPSRTGVLGAGERNLKIIREALGVSVAARDDVVRLSGERTSVGVARGVLERLVEEAGNPRAHLGGFTRQQVLDLIRDEADHQERAPAVDTGPWTGTPGDLAAGPTPDLGWDGKLDVYGPVGRRIEPRTENQRHYIQAIRNHDLVFGIGPAGTGKTYLAVAAAVHLLKADRIRKVVLVRPAVEAGEKLGFLPGNLEDKVNPYLRPLLDALTDMVDPGTVRRFMETDVVEIAPLAFMRGRTLNSAMVILDEAQNATRSQMKMFLTRMGQGTKMVVTGDVTQTDLASPADSGLLDAANRLRGKKGVAYAELTAADVVRHSLVQTIVHAYDETEAGDADG